MRQGSGWAGALAGTSSRSVQMSRRKGAGSRAGRKVAAMTNARVIGVRSVELGVRDLTQSAAFYRNVWGLDEVATDGGVTYLRGTGRDHHLLALREQGK